jgi:DNA-binding NarL/FixJ family response regulator
LSAPSRSDRLPRQIPAAWQTFLRSGEYAGAKASVLAAGMEVPVDLVARLEFLDERRLTIQLTLSDDATSSSHEDGHGLVRLLTPRERAVIALIAAGQETQEIALALHVSPATVRTHVRNAMTKLGAHTRAQLVAVAMAGREPVDVVRPGD